MKIAIVDDHDIFRQSLALLLAHSSAYTILGNFPSPEVLLAAPLPNAPDCVLLDYHMPNVDPLRALHLIQQRWPAAKVVFLTGTSSVVILQQLLASRAHGVLHKRDSAEGILQLLAKLAEGGGEQLVSPQIQEQVEGADAAFTSKELEVLRQLMHGLTPAQVAERLYVSKRTVEKHKENMMRKAKLHNLAQLLELGRRLALVE